MTFSVQLHYVLESFENDKESVLHLRKVYAIHTEDISVIELREGIMSIFTQQHNVVC